MIAPSLILATAFLGTGLLPSFPAALVLFTMLLVQISPTTPVKQILLAYVPLAMGTTLAYFKDINKALPSPAETGVTLLLLSAVLSSVPIITVYGSAWAERKWLNGREHGHSRLLLLPVLYMAVEGVLSRSSPLGRQGLFTPTDSILIDLLAPTVPHLGPSSLDFHFALWAKLLAEGWLAVNQRIGKKDSSGEDLLIELEAEDHGPSHSPLKVIAGLSLLPLMLSATLTPQPVPTSHDISTHTPLSIGCVLPSFLPTTSPLEDYLEETTRLASLAKVLLWPEAAISINSEQEYKSLLAKVAAITTKYRTYVDIGYTAPASVGGLEDTVQASLGPKRHNAQQMIGPDGKAIGRYLKSKTVPVAESFGTGSHPEPPPNWRIELVAPHGVTKPEWSTAEKGWVREVDVGALICNDLNFPSLLSHTTSSLQLVSANTFSEGSSRSLLNQARLRALESRSSILLCDSSPRGMSAFIDEHGRVRESSMGGKSFVVEWSAEREPRRRRESGYERVGEIGIVIGMGLVLGAVIGAERYRPWGRVEGIQAWVMEDLTRARGALMENVGAVRRRWGGQRAGEAQPLLIGED